MIRVTLDTNVLVSGFVGRYSNTSTPGALIRAWRRGLFQLAVSEVLLEEFQYTLEQPYFRQRMTDTEITDAQALLRAEALVVERTVTVEGVATHPEDDRILATAVSAQSAYLVTGDRGLHGVGHYRGVQLLSPREFLDLLEQQL